MLIVTTIIIGYAEQIPRHNTTNTGQKVIIGLWHRQACRPLQKCSRFSTQSPPNDKTYNVKNLTESNHHEASVVQW